MLISLVVAVSKNGVIGKDQDLPWRLSADLKRFKSITWGKPMVMGRKTYESIGRPLPGRTSIVVSRDLSYSAPGCLVAQSPEQAIAMAGEARELMIIGGARLFEHFLPRADRIYLTEVKAEVEGDVWFPGNPRDGFEEIEREEFDADDRNVYPFTYSLLERKA